MEDFELLIDLHKHQNRQGPGSERKNGPASNGGDAAVYT
jgi:hypothetical protein